MMQQDQNDFIGGYPKNISSSHINSIDQMKNIELIKQFHTTEQYQNIIVEDQNGEASEGKTSYVD